MSTDTSKSPDKGSEGFEAWCSGYFRDSNEYDHNGNMLSAAKLAARTAWDAALASVPRLEGVRKFYVAEDFAGDYYFRECGVPMMREGHRMVFEYVLLSDVEALLADESATQLRPIESSPDLTPTAEDYKTAWQMQHPNAMGANWPGIPGNPYPPLADLLCCKRKLEEAKAEVEHLQVQLAGCGVAATGWSAGDNRAKQGDYGWSPAYESTMLLREHSWRCFHCGFFTLDEHAAEAHFGERDDAEEFTPICKWWQRMDDGERAVAFQDTIKELNLLRMDLYDQLDCVTGANFVEMQQRAEKAEAALATAEEAGVRMALEAVKVLRRSNHEYRLKFDWHADEDGMHAVTLNAAESSILALLSGEEVKG